MTAPPGRSLAERGIYWWNFTFWPATVPIIPFGVTLMLWMLSPTGSDGSGTLMSWIAPSTDDTDDRSPLLDTRWMLITLWPVLVIRQTAVPLVTTRSIVAFTSLGPACVRVRPAPPRALASPPACEVIAFARAANVTSIVPLSRSIVPLLKDGLTCTPLMVALTDAISSGPSVMLLELILMSEKSLLITCVRNGKPSIDTCGFVGKPWFLICDAMMFSASARPPKSRPTSTTSTASTTMVRVRSRRLRRGRTMPYSPYCAVGGSPYWFIAGSPYSFMQAPRTGSWQATHVDGLQLAEVVVGC